MRGGKDPCRELDDSVFENTDLLFTSSLDDLAKAKFYIVAVTKHQTRPETADRRHPIGGHCIGVDPYYLVHKAAELKYHTQVIFAGRFVNDSMGGYIAKNVVKKIIASGKPAMNAHGLVMGLTFKENVADIRNSKVVDIIHELQDFGVIVDVVDPFADPKEVKKYYNIELKAQPEGPYNAIILAVAHNQYKELPESYFQNMSLDNGIFVDVKGLYRREIKEMTYWSL